MLIEMPNKQMNGKILGTGEINDQKVNKYFFEVYIVQTWSEGVQVWCFAR